MSMIVYLREATPTDVARLASEPDELDDFMFAVQPEGGGPVDFDKAWHALHFMLTGGSGYSDSPLSVLTTTDDRLIGADEFGFGGYWLIEADRVRALASELAAISDEQLASRYDPQAMLREHIYIGEVFADEGNDALPYLMQGVGEFRKLAARAAGAGNSIIGCMV